MFCPQCGKLSDASARFCGECGVGFVRADSNFVNMVGVGDSDGFYRAALGRNNYSYYFDVFQRFDSAGVVGVSWNWPAFFVTFYWLLYRKMWLGAFVYFFFPWLLVLFSFLIGNMAVVAVVFLLYFSVCFLLVPLYSNAFYYWFCNRNISKAKSKFSDVKDQLEYVSENGGTSSSVLIAVAVLLWVPVIMKILAAASLPAYQDYLIRSGLSEAAVVGSSAAEMVEKYYFENGEVPESLAAAGFDVALPRSVKDVAVDGSNGIVIVTVAISDIAGKRLLLIPSLEKNMDINWKCIGGEIPSKYLPQQCRRKE